MALPASNVAVGSVINLEFPILYVLNGNKELILSGGLDSSHSSRKDPDKISEVFVLCTFSIYMFFFIYEVVFVDMCNCKI